MNEEVQADIESILSKALGERYWGASHIDLTIADPFNTDAPADAVGLRVAYVRSDFDAGKWSRFLDDVEARFSSIGLDVHVGLSKRIHDPPSAMWILPFAVPASLEASRRHSACYQRAIAR